MYVIVQITSSEQVLGVQISHFEIMFNSTIKFGNYCCCDDPDSSSCVKVLETLQECQTACDLHFSLDFKHCTTNTSCFILPESIDLSFDNTFQMSSVIFQIPFNESDLERYNQVRICSYIISKSATIEICYMGSQKIKGKSGTVFSIAY